MPWDALEEVVWILTFGAKKYTINYETEWDRLLDANDVVEIKISTAKTNVVVVTKKNSEKIILNSRKDKDKIVAIGQNETILKLKNIPSAGKLINIAVQEIKEQNGLESLRNITLLNNNTMNFAREVVRYVEESNIFILTIVTKQGNLEVFFVPSAIMDSDFWEIIWKDLKEQFNILRPSNATGDRNWEKGMSYGRLIRAGIGHFISWARRENNDPETGRSHLAHAICCALFLLAYSIRGVGTDDRPT